MSFNVSQQIKRVNIMFISRGRGRGHAVPDIAIGEELSACECVSIQFVSYATGAEVFREFGLPCIDLEKPQDPNLLEMVSVYTELLNEHAPHLVVAHEEFPAIPAANQLGIPVVFITDYFLDPSSPMMQLLSGVEEIIFTGERGVFVEPPFLATPVNYVGRAVRHFKYSLLDRRRARSELDIPDAAKVALFQPGSWSEARMSIGDLVMAAWARVKDRQKRLLWLAGGDYDRLSARFRGVPDVTILRPDWQIDRLIVASNVVVTKANRLTVFEAAALGVPSISISNMLNWPDDVAIRVVESNTLLFAQRLDLDTLVNALERSFALRFDPALALSGGISGAAARVRAFAERIVAGGQAAMDSARPSQM